MSISEDTTHLAHSFRSDIKVTWRGHSFSNSVSDNPYTVLLQGVAPTKLHHAMQWLYLVDCKPCSSTLREPKTLFNATENTDRVSHYSGVFALCRRQLREAMTGLNTLVADHSARSADTLGRASDEAVSEREINYYLGGVEPRYSLAQKCCSGVL